MNYYPGDIIQLGPNHRLVVEQDDYNDCPRDGDYSTMCGAVTVENGNSNYVEVPEIHTPTIPISEAHDRLYGLGACMLVRHYVSRETSVVRWAAIFHGLALQYDDKYRVYWFVKMDGDGGFTANWPDLKLGTAEHLAKQHEVINQERETYRQWAEGEVYGVGLEVRIGYGGPDTLDIEVEHIIEHECEADCPEHWDRTECIWGNYFSDDYGPLEVAKDYFVLDGAVLPE